jgi:hypothetical protein
MMKLFISAILAASVCVPQAAAQSLVQRSDWQDRKFETYLPKPDATVPWLELDTKTRLPKGDIPLRRDVASVGRLALPPLEADIRVSTHVTTSRSM